MIIAVDFDGTLCEDKYPEIGESSTSIIQTLKGLQNRGVKLILWTCRNGQALIDALAWCTDQGLHFDAVNENLKEIQAKYGGDTRKVYADYYLDDKNTTPWTLLNILVEIKNREE